MFYLLLILVTKFIVEPCESREQAVAVMMFLCELFFFAAVCYYFVAVVVDLFLKFLFATSVLVAIVVDWDFCTEISLNYYWNLSINYFNMFSFI